MATFASALPPALTNLTLIHPFQFDDPGPLIEVYPLPPAHVAVATGPHPSGMGVTVTTMLDGTPHVLWFDLADRVFNAIPGIDPDPGPLVSDRFGDLYMMDEGRLLRASLIIDEGAVFAEQVAVEPVEFPFDALAVNDASDLIYGLALSGGGWITAYNRDFDYFGSWPLPVGMAIGGKVSMAVNRAGDLLRVGSELSPHVHRFRLDPSSGEAVYEASSALPGIAGISDLQLTDTERLVVVSDQRTSEFSWAQSSAQWLPTDETGYEGYEGYTSFSITRSRSNAGHYADPADDPYWPEILPEEALDLCLPDADRDGVVGFADLLIVLSSWGPCDLACPGDVTEDAVVDFADLLLVLSSWGPC